MTGKGGNNMVEDLGCYNCGDIEKESYSRQEGTRYLCNGCVQGHALAEKNKGENARLNEKRKIKRIRR